MILKEFSVFAETVVVVEVDGVGVAVWGARWSLRRWRCGGSGVVVLGGWCGGVVGG